MKILVDKMPNSSKECCFSSKEIINLCRSYPGYPILEETGRILCNFGLSDRRGPMKVECTLIDGYHECLFFKEFNGKYKTREES